MPCCQWIAGVQVSTVLCLVYPPTPVYAWLTQALLQCCAALVKNMGKAEADAALQGPLMLALLKAFQHSCADVRKSVG